MNKIKQFFSRKSTQVVAITGLAMGASSSAMAVDLSGITGSIDFSTATAGVLTVGGALAGVYLAIKAAKMVLGFLK